MHTPLSTGREVAATNSPRRLEAPKLHNPIAIRLNLLIRLGEKIK